VADIFLAIPQGNHGDRGGFDGAQLRVEGGIEARKQSSGCVWGRGEDEAFRFQFFLTPRSSQADQEMRCPGRVPGNESFYGSELSIAKETLSQFFAQCTDERFVP
jgi:hypothetical protein